MKWEYKTIEIDKLEGFKDTTKLQEELNSYGAEGWELITILQPQHVGEGWLPKIHNDVVTFKRKIEN